jgi:phage FluMu protein Com
VKFENGKLLPRDNFCSILEMECPRCDLLFIVEFEKGYNKEAGKLLHDELRGHIDKFHNGEYISV